MKVSQVCRTDVAVISKMASIEDAARGMKHYNVGSLIVSDKVDDKLIPIGIITDRDTVTRVIAEGRPLQDMQVGDIMSKHIFTLNLNQDTHDAIHFLYEKGVRRAPVVDDEGHLSGIVTLDDLILVISDQLQGLIDIIESQSPVLRRSNPSTDLLEKFVAPSNKKQRKS